MGGIYSGRRATTPDTDVCLRLSLSELRREGAVRRYQLRRLQYAWSRHGNCVAKLTIVVDVDCHEPLPCMRITSDNSRGKFETHFVQNIQTEYLKVQVLICSPSLGTGIDISFPDARCEVHEVFGFFSPHVNKHTDIDQQLARVRNPGSVSVWFDGGGSNYETSLDVIRRQLALANYVPTAINGRLDDDGNPSFNDDDPLLNIAAHVMVAQRSSQNRIVPLFGQLQDLDRFKQLLTDNRVMIEEALKASLRRDFAKNPVRQLNVFLGFCGLTLVATKRRQRAGQANIEYQIDPTSVKSMTSFL